MTKILMLIGIPASCLAFFLAAHDTEGTIWSASGLALGIIFFVSFVVKK